MRHISRTHFAIGLLAAVVAVAGAAVQPDPGAAVRQGIVRASLEQQGKPADNAVLLDAASRAHLLSAVTFDAGDPNSVVLRTEGKPLFDHIVLEDGKKVVLDVYDSLNGLSGTKFVPEGKGPVREVKTDLFALEPRFVSRVTLNLSRISRVSFAQDEGLIRISFSSPQDAMTSAGAARKLESQFEERLRRVAVRQAGIDEQIARWESARALATKKFDADFASVARMLSDGKRGALTQRLLDAIPREGAVSTCSVDTSEAGLMEADRAVLSQKAELKEALAARESAVAAVRAESAAHADKTVARLTYDLNALRALEERLATKEGAKDPEALQIVQVLETKLTRLQGDDLGPFEDASARCTAAIQEYHATLNAAAGRLAGARAALTALMAERKNAPRAAAGDGADVAIAALNREVSRLKGDEVPTAAKPAKHVAAERVADAPYAYIKPVSVPAKVLKPQVAALAGQLEAVKDAQLQLALAPVQPMAAISTDGASDLDATTSPILAQAADEPVATDTPAEPAQTPEGESVPEEQAAAPEQTPAEAPAAPPAEQPAAPAEPQSPPPAPEAPAEPEPEPAPVKSEVIVAPTPETSNTTTGDITSLNEPVNIDLREMELSNFVALLARKAGINVIAGTELSGTVTASIRNVPLMQALQMVLRMHDLGVVEEEGVYRIIPYEDSLLAERVTEMLNVSTGKVEDIKLTLDNILMNAPDGKAVSIATNPETNTIIISGPPKRVEELKSMVQALDVAKPVTPTVTEAIKLNYALPEEVQTMVKGILTKETGQASIDLRGRHIVVTDYPAVVEQIRKLVEEVDIPTKQVSIEAMIVDAVLSDGAETGVDWVLNAVQHLNTRGEVIGSLQQGAFGTSTGNVGTSALNAGLLTFNVLTKDVNIQAAIAAEASSRNAKILATPQIVIVENEEGNISIVDEYPYQEITQTTQGPPVATTEFKPIGVTLGVTPRVTHTNEIITVVEAKQSSVSGLTETGIPIEAKREASTTLNVKDGQTIFIGGLRRHDDRLEVNKVPVLGDVPVLNFLFRNTKGEKVNTELMVFMTCRVMGEHLPELTVEQQQKHDELSQVPEVPNAQKEVLRSFVKPGEMRDPVWRRPPRAK